MKITTTTTIKYEIVDTLNRRTVIQEAESPIDFTFYDDRLLEIANQVRAEYEDFLDDKTINYFNVNELIEEAIEDTNENDDLDHLCWGLIEIGSVYDLVKKEICRIAGFDPDFEVYRDEDTE